MHHHQPKPPWVLAHERGCNLTQFKQGLTADQQKELVSFLVVCNRWSDIKSLMTDPQYGAEATAQYQHQQAWAAWEAQRQQEIAALPEIFRQITLTFRRIW